MPEGIFSSRTRIIVTPNSVNEARIVQLENTLGRRGRGCSPFPGTTRGVNSDARGVAARTRPRDLHYLLRSTVGRFNIVIMPFFVVVMGVLVARDVTGPVLGLDRSSLVSLSIQVAAYRVLFGPASRLLGERRESLVEAVQALT